MISIKFTGPNRRTLRGFNYGVLASAAFFSLYADFWGLEGYINHIRETWIEPVYTVPIALAFLVLSFYWLIRDDRKDTQSK